MVVVQGTLLKALSEDSMLSGSPQSRARDLLAAVKLTTAFAEMPMPGGSSADLLLRIVEETLEDAPTS
jgi:muramoyltetrapeptide carboxypeptidase LdcA involved in peptidoglycan recycling